MSKKMIDIHCHILPGVDDGASTRKEVQTMLMKEYKDGVRAIVLTPHYRKDMFEPSTELVKKRFAYVKKEIQNLGLNMDVYLGCEYHANGEMIEELKQNPYFRINGSEYVLVEFSSLHTYDKVRNSIYQLISGGFKPIIAHVERYSKVVDKLEKVEELIQLGAYIQVSSSSILGEDGLRLKWISRSLLKKGWIHFVATDAHNTTDRSPNLKACAEYVAKKEGRNYAENLFINNPRKILGCKD